MVARTQWRRRAPPPRVHGGVWWRRTTHAVGDAPRGVLVRGRSERRNRSARARPRWRRGSKRLEAAARRRRRRPFSRASPKRSLPLDESRPRPVHQSAADVAGRHAAEVVRDLAARAPKGRSVRPGTAAVAPIVPRAARKPPSKLFDWSGPTLAAAAATAKAAARRRRGLLRALLRTASPPRQMFAGRAVRRLRSRTTTRGPRPPFCSGESAARGRRPARAPAGGGAGACGREKRRGNRSAYPRRAADGPDRVAKGSSSGLSGLSDAQRLHVAARDRRGVREHHAVGLGVGASSRRGRGARRPHERLGQVVGVTARRSRR